MSTMEYTKATFTTLHGSEGMSTAEVIAVFSPLIGEPTDSEDEDGEIHWFTYARDVEGSYHRSRAGTWEPVPWKNKWALRFTLAHSRDYDDDPLSITVTGLRDLVAQAEDLAKKAGFEPGQTTLTAYSWYNGVDEPDPDSFETYKGGDTGPGSAS